VKLESGPKEGQDDEAMEVHGRVDHGGLQEQEAGVSTAEVCRKHGDKQRYAWKATLSGIDVSEAKRLKHLEDENAKLKRLLANRERCHTERATRAVDSQW
jgi:hypothetical protein